MKRMTKFDEMINTFYFWSKRILLLVMFIFMICFANKNSFWFDEMWLVGAISEGNINKFLHILVLDNQLPLYFIIEFFVYKLAPYGEIWLRLPSILFVILGVAFLNETGEKAGGKATGFISLSIAVISYILICIGGWNIRPYALLFCTSSLTIIFYFNRLRAMSNRNNILYGISILLLSLTHWFGLLFISFLFMTDFFRMLKKRFSFKDMLVYLFLLPSVIWFVLVVINKSSLLLSFWIKAPTFETIYEVFKYLLSYTPGFYLLFGLGCLFILLNKKNYNADNIWLVLLLSIAYIIGIVFIYSRYINPQSSLFAYNYFFVIMPHVFLITAYGISRIIKIPITVNDKISDVKIWNIELKYFIAIYFAVFFFKSGVFNYKECVAHPFIENHYRQAADYLAENKNYVSKNTLVLLGGDDIKGGYVNKGFCEYYFKKRSSVMPSNCASFLTRNRYYLYRKNDQIVSRLVNMNEVNKWKFIFLVEADTLPEDLIKYYELEKKFPDMRFSIYKKLDNYDNSYN